MKWREIKPLFQRALSGGFVPCICVAHYARSRVIPKYPFDSPRGGIRAIADDDDAGVLRISHPYSTTLVNRNP